jgi:hypothetical protein
MTRHATRKNTRAENTTSTSDVQAVAEAADAMSKLACTQFETCLHAFGAMFKAAEEMHSIQLEAARSVRRTHEAALAKLTEAKGSPDLFGLASELLRFDTDGSMRYWQALGDAMTRMNTEMLEASSRDMAAMADRAYAALATAAPDQKRASVLGAEFATLMERLAGQPASASTAGQAAARQAADAATEAWQRWLKLSEDWTKLALTPSASEATAAH